MTAAPAHVPLVVGVTGHRDLVDAEVPILERSVEAFFDALRVRFPGLPLRVMTPLAEGADLLVARVARRLGLPLTVLLPMPMSQYRDDFEGVAAAEFEEMRGQGEIIELPTLGCGPEQSTQLSGDARDAQYEYLGIYLAAHCHILLALWDGKPSPAPGGTAQVIRFHQYNEVKLISGVEARSAIDFSEDESDLAYHIVCSRAGNGAPADERTAGEGAWLTRDDLEPRTAELPVRYQQVFRQQERLNRDLAAVVPAPQSQAARNDADWALFGEIGSLAAAVDRLAVHFQKRALRSLKAVYVMAALTGISFIAYADFPDHQGMIWAYLCALLVGFVLYAVERRGAWYRRYIDYRGLAQGLRVQAYWAIAGVHLENPTEFAHDRFMRREELSLGWIRNAMRYAGRRADAHPEAPAQQTRERVIEEWIQDQRDYYRRRLHEHLRHDRTISRLGVGGFLVALAAALALALFQARLSPFTVNALIASMAGLPFLVAVRSSYAERVCERELAAQYAHMNRIYTNAHRLLHRTSDAAARREILRALGEEALQEVGLWILRQRERPVSGNQIFRA